MAEGTSLIDDSTGHSTNSTYDTHLLIIEETTSSHLQVTTPGDLSQINSELPPTSARSPLCLQLPPSIENFGEIEHDVLNTPIL